MVLLSDPMPGARRATMATDPERIRKSRGDAAHDASLVARFTGGDDGAFDEIVGRHRARLFSVAFSKVWNRGDAEEIVQDTFIRAHRGLPTFRGDCSLSTWLHHIALNLARNRYWYFHRRFRHATISLDCAVGEEDSSTLLDYVACNAAGPRRETVTREFVGLIAECMLRLEERQRRILILTHTLGYAEIAQQLGLNVGTVKSRIARARERLHSLLCAACPEFAASARHTTWFESTRDQAGITSPLNPR